MKPFPRSIPLTCFLLAICFADSAQCDPETGRERDVLKNGGVVSERFPTEQNAAEADSMELIGLADQRPFRLRIRTTVEGKSIEQLRREFFRRLFVFLDRDGDRTLSPVEAHRAPSATVIDQWSWGYFRMLGTLSGTVDSAPVSDDPLSYDSFLSEYASSGIGGLTVAGARCRSSERLTERLLARIDQNRNDKLSREEFAAAEQALQELDVNGDELIASGELAFQVDSPYPLATIRMTPVPATRKPAAPKLPLLVLTPNVPPEVWTGAVIEQYACDGDATLAREQIGWSRARFTALDDDQDHRLDAKELRKWRDRAPEYSVAVRLDDAVSTVNVLHGQRSAPSAGRGETWTSAGSRIEIDVRPSRLHQRFARHRQEMTHQFTALDADGSRNLNAQEITDGDAPSFKGLLILADRDENGTLSEGELEGFLCLQQRAVASHLRLSILDHRRGLFSAVDTDRDGCLSIPELRAARGLLRSENQQQAKGLDPANLPRHYSLIFSRGQPLMNTAPVLPGKTSPAWFRAMDVNSDRVVSWDEFLGDRESFDKYDKNQDGLLAPKEGRNGDAVCRDKPAWNRE